jgi:hypothetical protein
MRHRAKVAPSGEGGRLATAATPVVAPTAASWSTPREALHVVFLRSTLRKTIRIALVVGTILSLINQLGVIMDGKANVATWIRVGANYLVPFCVSSTGFLTATKRSDP